MFNHDAYNARLAEIKTEITIGDDQTWLMDVSLRYGRWLAERARDQLQTVVDLFPGIDVVQDKQKHRNYCAEQIMGVVAGMYSSSALIRGAIKIADPLGAEAMMRVFAEAGFKKDGARPVDADADFRVRIRSAAKAAGVDGVGKDDPLLERIDTATGSDLDKIGERYGVLRSAAVAAAGSASQPVDQATEG